jgi:alcohol dehydrogenase
VTLYGPELQFTWKTPTRVVFGTGKLERLGREARALGSRVLVVTDPFLSTQGHIVGRAVDSLRQAGLDVEVFDDVESDPSIEAIDRGIEAARPFAPDVFVGIGGGSSMDAAKAINLLLACGDRVVDHLGANTVTRPLPPVIAVPTTAGTGSETSWAAVISDHERRVKIPLADDNLTPRLAILDPELTRGLPARLTAATGMDAHAHAIDVLHSVRRQPFNDALAYHVLRTVHLHLVRAVAEPDDLVARGQMLAAACSMGFALSTTPYGIIHALGHPLGAHHGVHHGVSVALLSSPGMKWNLEAAQEIYAEAARAAGLAGHGQADGEAAEALVVATESLMVQLQLPRRLSELGVTEASLSAMSQDAAGDIGARFNVRPGAPASELEEVYRSVL